MSVRHFASVLVAAAVIAAALPACSEKRRGEHHASHVDASTNAEEQLPANARVALAAPVETTPADRAVLAAQVVVHRDRDQLDAWVDLGHAWIRKARASDDVAAYVSADACASVVLAKETDHVGAADVRARVLFARREWAEARRLAERITSQHPESEVAWGHLTEALLELGRYEEAKDAVRKMLALGRSSRAHELTARIQWLHGDVVGAKESLANAVDAARDGEAAARAHVLAATMSWHAGDYDGAGAAFDKALERVSDFAPALAGHGRVAMARSEWHRAAQAFARSYDVMRTLETAWLLGDAREAGGDAKGASEAYDLVEKHAANDPLAYSRYLSAKKERTPEQRSEALRLASEVHVKQYDVHTEDALAWALHRAGMTETAKPAMGRARRLHTPDARFLFHEGAIRIAAGDVKKGKETIAKALAMNRAFDWREAREARELVSR